MSRLAGSVALISGGLGDIGKALGRSLADEGAHIAVGDVMAEDGGFVAELEALGVAARYDQVDVRDSAAVAAWYEAVAGDLGLPTLIVPNAAIVAVSELGTITPEDWQRHLDVNLTGAFFVAQEGARRLRDAGEPGRIVFIGSWVADVPDPTIIPYCVSKAGLRMLMREMAKVLAQHDILVNEVAPGFVDAGVSAQVFRDQPERREECLVRAPVGRLISADEVATQVVHLCDPANRHMAGAVLLMDGGNSL